MRLDQALIVTLTLLFGVLTWWLANPGISAPLEIPRFVTNSMNCEPNGNPQTDTFVIFVNAQQVAETLAKSLCNNDIVSKQFGRVSAYWSAEDAHLMHFLGKGLANLVLAKDHFMLALETQQTQGYRQVAGYRDYTAYLISLTEKPKLEKAYLLGKRVGLIDYPSSRSGHIIPMQLFKQLQLGESHLQLSYASSHDELRELLVHGEVDLIASYWEAQDARRLSEKYITPLQAGVPGSKWYLRMDSENSELFCAVQKTLGQLASRQEITYFSQISLATGCADLMTDR